MACVFIFNSNLNAQHQELNEAPKLWGKSQKAVDSSNLLYRFQMGSMHGHLRTFFSSTDNKNSAVEYAQAIGGGIQFISKPLYKAFLCIIPCVMICNSNGSCNVKYKKKPWLQHLPEISDPPV